MSKVVIYQEVGMPVSVVMPGNEDLDILLVGTLSTPEGLPFWIIDQYQLPADRSMRNAWDIDFIEAGEPSGYGANK